MNTITLYRLYAADGTYTEASGRWLIDAMAAANLTSKPSTAFFWQAGDLYPVMPGAVDRAWAAYQRRVAA